MFGNRARPRDIGVRLLDAHLQETRADFGSMSSLSEPATISRREGNKTESATTSSSKSHHLYVPALRKDRGNCGINRVSESSVVLRFANLVSLRMDNTEHVAAHAHDDRKAVREKVLEICCRTVSPSVVHCLVNLEAENASLKEELRSVQEVAHEQSDKRRGCGELRRSHCATTDC